MYSLDALKKFDLDGFNCTDLSFKSCGKIDLGIMEDVCPVCGKVYSRTTQHGWRLGENKKYKYFCSHSCMRVAEKEREERARKKAEAAIDRDLEIISMEGRCDLTPEEKKNVKKANARLEFAMKKKGILL